MRSIFPMASREDIKEAASGPWRERYEMGTSCARHHLAKLHGPDKATASRASSHRDHPPESVQFQAFEMHTL